MRPTVPIFAFLIAFIPATSLAASTAQTNSYREDLLELNRIKPLQNPQYETSQNVLERRMLDRKNKVVGSVEDVILNENGNIAAFNVKFDRLQLSRPVIVNYNSFDIGAVSNGYAMTSFEADEIKDLYPTLLADIETAAGDKNETQSLKNLQGVGVTTVSGRKIGKLDDVLFEADGKRAAAAYITLTAGNMRGIGIAIPFRQIDFSQTATTREVIVTDEYADAMAAYLKNE